MSRSLLTAPCTVLIVLTVGTVSPSDASHPCRQDGSTVSVLLLHNHTDTPICVYLDGRFVCDCESFMRVKVLVQGAGQVELVGRHRCDTWGPIAVNLVPCESSQVTFREEDRRVAGVTPRTR